MTNGPPAKHTDQFTPLITSESAEYTAPTSYQPRPEKAEFGEIASNFEEPIELVHPAPDVETLRQTTHIAAQLHEHNKDRWTSETGFENDGSQLYDWAILTVAEEALRIEGLTLSSIDIPDRRFLALFLKAARLAPTIKGFYEDFVNSPGILAELGYANESEVPSYETFRIAASKELPVELDEIDRGSDAFESAVIRAIYAAFRNGIVPPEQVLDEYGFNAVAPPLNEAAVPRQYEQLALRNWIELLATETLEHLTFHRKQRQFSIFQYLGLFAASALYKCGFQEVPNVADYSYNRALIPKGSAVPKYIKSQPRTAGEAAIRNDPKLPLTEQFDAAHRSTLNIARRRGFFSEPLSLAADLFRIEWSGDDTTFTINRPEKFENDVRSEWTFAALGIIDTDARFTIGARWIPRKSHYPAVINELSPITNEYVDTATLYADSELISGRLIEAFRGIAGEDWVVRAPNHELIRRLKRFTPGNHIGYVPSISWNTNPKPAAIAYPYDSESPKTIEFTERELKQVDPTPADHDPATLTAYSQTNSRDPPDLPTLQDQFDNPHSLPGFDNPNTHTAYLTDRTLPDRSADGIHYQYYQRWAIETGVDQISNHFMPVINSGEPKLRLYGVNIAMMLQNWHTLINRAPSPNLGLRLDVTHQELLKAILHMAFNETN